MPTLKPPFHDVRAVSVPITSCRGPRRNLTFSTFCDKLVNLFKYGVTLIKFVDFTYKVQESKILTEFRQVR